MKLYIISGLGGGYKVLERLKFPAHIDLVFIPWLIPYHLESFCDYVDRMAEKIDKSEPFYLLGYSFGGIVAQEIHKKYPAKKIVILGSIKSDKEKSKLLKISEATKITQFLPKGVFNNKSFLMYNLLRKLFDPKNPEVLKYFEVRDPYYIKWSINKISDWKFKELPDVIQIMGDKDIVFPIKFSKPDYVIKGGTHLFPVTKYKKVSQLLMDIYK